MNKRALLFVLVSMLVAPSAVNADQQSTVPTLESVQRRAFDYFWHESDPHTGLTKDRAQNIGSIPDTHTIASIAATGYALASLPVAASHGWVSKHDAYYRALTTLRFVHDKLPNNHGFYYHFVDWRTGERQWKCELSSIDSALLFLGALVAGQYWHGTEVDRLAQSLNDRADWQWMLTNGGDKPRELALAMGWKPEDGWIESRWVRYTEAAYLYWLAMGSRTHPVSSSVWDAWEIKQTTLEGYPVLGGAFPLFIAQMAPAYIDVRGLHDRQGRYWWTMWANAHRADQMFCQRNPEHRATYSEGFWGISANDQPGGYGAESPAVGEESGTVSPTAMLTVVMFDKLSAQLSLKNMWQRHSDRLWGRYGFSNAFNVDKNWYDSDVLGIDLGMMLLAIENSRTALIWQLTGRARQIKAGIAAAGMAPPAGRKATGS